MFKVGDIIKFFVYPGLGVIHHIDTEYYYIIEDESFRHPRSPNMYSISWCAKIFELYTDVFSEEEVT